MRSYLTYLGFFAILVSMAPVSVFAAEPMTTEQMIQYLKDYDQRMMNMGDFKALAYVESKEKNKDDLVQQIVVYRRDQEDKYMQLILKPKSEAGSGYLQIDRSLFYYDPTTGKWSRKTNRERISGTSSRPSDLDDPGYSKKYTPTYAGLEKLGKFSVHHLKLDAKKDADVAYPVSHVWFDVETGNMLKHQEYALSGKLIRTSYYPSWTKIYSASKGGDVYFYKEIRFYDEIEKDKQTVIVVQEVDLNPLEANIFTKAWLESKSR